MQPRVSKLFEYPLKSGAPNILSTMNITHRGAENDRRWMLVKPNGRFLSQRDPGCEQIGAILPIIDAEKNTIRFRKKTSFV